MLSTHWSHAPSPVSPAAGAPEGGGPAGGGCDTAHRAGCSFGRDQTVLENQLVGVSKPSGRISAVRGANGREGPACWACCLQAGEPISSAAVPPSALIQRVVVADHEHIALVGQRQGGGQAQTLPSWAAGARLRHDALSCPSLVPLKCM